MDTAPYILGAIVASSTTILGFLLKRFIDEWDTKLKGFDLKLGEFSSRLEDMGKTQGMAMTRVQNEFRLRAEMLANKINSSLVDFKETRLLLSVVREELKTKVVKDDELKGKIIWILDQYPNVEKRFSEISSEIAVLKSTMSHKKNSGKG